MAKQMAREAERQHKASQRAYAAAMREAESARKREQQAYVRAQMASAAERKRLEKEARETHEAAWHRKWSAGTLGSGIWRRNWKES
jgi:hypothetical protein